MPRFYIETTSMNRMVDARDWEVKWDLVIFYDAEGEKVLAVKAETVKEVTKQPPQESQ